MADTLDWKVTLKLTLDENSNPKWVSETIIDSLEAGEDLFEFSAVPVEDSIDYKKDLIAALEQIKMYSDNVLVIGTDGHQYSLDDKLTELKK